MADGRDLGFHLDAGGLSFAAGLLAEALQRPRGLPGDAVLDLPDTLPIRGVGERAALSRLAPSTLEGARHLGDPGFFAHMDPPTPWVAWAAAMWAASLNQNLLHPDTAPVARALEERVVAWLAPHFGMGGGHIVPGSSVANLTALWAARELRGVRRVVCSEAAHVSVRKAASILGLAWEAVGTDEFSRLDERQLGDVSDAILVLTAGTVAAGAVDPLALAGRAAWTHVDAAWAGPLRLSPRHAGVLEGVQRADSVAVSAHKWLFQPKESALVLFAAAEAAHEALSFGSGYLAVPNVGVLGSHGSAALPLAATLLAWGRDGIGARIAHCMDLAQHLARLVEDHPGLELFAQPTTGVVLWRPSGIDPFAVRSRLRRSFVSHANLDGERWLRSVAANPMADPELVVEDVVAVAGLEC